MPDINSIKEQNNLMMSSRRMKYEKMKKNKRESLRSIAKNTNMHDKWKNELRRV